VSGCGDGLKKALYGMAHMHIIAEKNGKEWKMMRQYRLSPAPRLSVRLPFACLQRVPAWL
jgi:hypothetical protein